MRWPLFRFVREPSRLKGRLLFKVFKSVDDLNSGLQLQRLSLNTLLVFCLQVTSPNEFKQKNHKEYRQIAPTSILFSRRCSFFSLV